MIRRLVFGLAFALTCTATAVHAGPITLTINNITGIWTDVDPDVASGVGTNQIRWGSPASSAGQSGYDFDAAVTPISGIAPGDGFNLGTFRHINYPIYAPSITFAQLTVDIDATITNGITQNVTLSSVYDFRHFETPNGANPCAAGGSQPCPDLVTALLNESISESVTIDGTDYYFDVLGFQVGGSTFTDFLTLENRINEAQLMGTFRGATAVPEPATMALLGVGLLGLGLANRRRKVI